MLSAWINKKYLNPIKLKEQFQSNKPFLSLVLRNFFNSDRLLPVLEALTKEQFYIKDSDLFTFFQTNDFKNTTNQTLKKFRTFLASTELVNYISQITVQNLRQEIDCFGTIYQDTNYLLPHDDRVEKRRVAYMIYLSNFSKKEGGALNFYSSKDNKPIKISHSIVPTFNTFVLFEVSIKSFHSVSEVKAKKQRITITGWFYDK